MNINTDTAIFTHSPEELLHGYVNESADLRREGTCTDDEKISVTSSETTSVQDIHLPANKVIVKDSSDVHIGDRTYLTIQHNVPSDDEVIKKIIKDAIVSSNVRAVLNVETAPELLGTRSGAFLKSLEFVAEDSANVSHPKNGIKTFKDGADSNTAENRNLGHYFNFCGYPFTFQLCAVLLVVVLSIVTGVCFAIWKLTGDKDSTPASTTSYPSYPSRPYPTAPIDTKRTSVSPPPPTSSFPHPNGWYLRTRKDWNAQELENTVEYLHHPVKNAIIAHTAGGTCLTEFACLEKLRGIQASAVQDRGFDDIPYNFLVGGDGNAFEGLGWDIKGSHSNKYNSVSIGIAFIGNFVFQHPTPQQLEAAKRLLVWGVEIGKLDPDYRLIPHNLTYAVSSPGRFVYQEIKNWPHFTEERFYIPS